MTAAFDVHQLIVSHPSCVAPVKMIVTRGSIPKQLKGTYYKVGPAFDPSVISSAHHHPFDADGYITKVTFPGEGANAWYQSRFIGTDAKRGKGSTATAFGGPLLSLSGLRNPSNTNVMHWSNKLLTWYDAGAPYVLNPDTLETEGRLPYFQDGLPIQTGVSMLDRYLRRMQYTGDCINAHPKIDASGRLIAMGLAYCIVPSLHTQVAFHQISVDGGTDIKSVTVPGLAYMHDFLITDEYYIFIHHPMRLRMNQKNTGIAGALTQDSRLPSMLYMVPRNVNASQPVRIVSLASLGTFFSSHHIKADFDGATGELTIETISYPGYMKTPGKVMRISISNKGNVTHQLLPTSWQEFPIQSSDGVGWYATCQVAGHPMESICRYDPDTNVQSAIETPKRGMYWGEPALGNDGTVMAICHDSIKNTTRLTLFDGALKHELCEMAFPYETVPLGLHGTFV